MRMSAQQIDIYGWQLAEVLANRRALFVLWAVKTLFCTTRADFLHHYKISENELNPLLDRLTVQGFLQQDGENYVLTELGEKAVGYLGELDISEFAHPERLSTEVNIRFESVEREDLSAGGTTDTWKTGAGDTTDVVVEDIHDRNVEIESL